jgi:chromosomal replication initiator protein
VSINYYKKESGPVIAAIWDNFLNIVKEEVGTRVVDTWFKAVTLSQWDALNKVVYLQTPNRFVKDWIETNYTALIRTHLGRLLNDTAFKIVFVSQDNAQATHIPARVVPQTVTKLEKETHYVPAKLSLAKRAPVNKSYIFDTFVVGPSNSLAYAAAQAVTEKPGRLYNPLFFYGGSGLGKTHLLHAIGNEIKRRFEKAEVLYQTADRFVNEFINAIRFDKVHKFQMKYKSVDVLLIDDIQFISNKEQTQEAFFHIFNTLHDMHKQIVFSSDTVPNDIQGLAERLRSRLAWGLVADIRVPTLETKMAILKKKAELNNETLSDEVAEYIAGRVVSNIRELEGSLVRIMAFASLTNQPVTLDLVKKVLIRDSQTKKKEVDFEEIIKALHRHYPFKLEELRSKNRNKELSLARHVAMFLMKKMTDRSLRDIGLFLGGRDHSTVMHAIDKVTQESKTSHDLHQTIQRIEQDIRSKTV